MKALKIIGSVFLVVLALLSGLYILGRDSDRLYPEGIKGELTDVDGIFDQAMSPEFLAPLFKEGYLTVGDDLVNSSLYYIMVSEQESLDTEEIRVNYVYTDFLDGQVMIKAHVDLKEPIKYPTSIKIYMDVYGQGTTVGAKLNRVTVGKITLPNLLIKAVANRQEFQTIADTLVGDRLAVDYEQLSLELSMDQLSTYFLMDEVKVVEGGLEIHGETPLEVADLLERQSIPETYLELADLVIGTLQMDALTEEISGGSSEEDVVLSGLEAIIVQSQESGLESLKVTDLLEVYFTLEQMDEDSYQSLLKTLDEGDQLLVKLLVEELRDVDYSSLLNKALDSIL